MNEDFRADFEFIKNKHNQKIYANMWVALKNGKLLATYNNRQILLAKVKEHYPDVKHPTVFKFEEFELNHSLCSSSTGIDGSPTFGQGELDDNGFFEFPCEVCRQRYLNKLPLESKDPTDHRVVNYKRFSIDDVSATWNKPPGMEYEIALDDESIINISFLNNNHPPKEVYLLLFINHFEKLKLREKDPRKCDILNTIIQNLDNVLNNCKLLETIE